MARLRPLAAPAVCAVDRGVGDARPLSRLRSLRPLLPALRCAAVAVAPRPPLRLLRLLRRAGSRQACPVAGIAMRISRSMSRR